MNTNPLWPRQAEILRAMIAGEPYGYGGSFPAATKHRALQRMRERGLIENKQPTELALMLLEQYDNDPALRERQETLQANRALKRGSDEVSRLAALAGSQTKLAKALGINHTSVSRWRGTVPKNQYWTIYKWAEDNGHDVSWLLK